MMEFQIIATLLLIIVVVVAVVIFFIFQSGELTDPAQELTESAGSQAGTATGSLENFCVTDAQCSAGQTCVKGQCQ